MRIINTTNDILVYISSFKRNVASEVNIFYNDLIIRYRLIVIYVSISKLLNLISIKKIKKKNRLTQHLLLDIEVEIIWCDIFSCYL